MDKRPRIISKSILAVEGNDECNFFQAMLKQLNLFDRDWNQNGTGLKHQYEARILNGVKVVIDYATGLVWPQDGSATSLNFKDATDYVQKLNQKHTPGFDEWRLATLEEAMSLVEPEKKQNGLCIDPIFDPTQRWIWTSDSVAGGVSGWIVIFGPGRCDYQPFSFTYPVRAVQRLQPHLLL